MERIESAIAFILECEKLKLVLRKTRPVGSERFENSAEHSWQTTLAALLFIPKHLDALTVVKMLLIHDLVEIDVGDTFVYDDAAREAVRDAEEAAARRLFGLLPEPLGPELLSLWIEFEDRASPEAEYAKAVDRLCPVIQNLNSPVSSWQEYKISKDRVIAKNCEIENVDPKLWEHLLAAIEDAAEFADG